MMTDAAPSPRHAVTRRSVVGLLLASGCATLSKFRPLTRLGSRVTPAILAPDRRSISESSDDTDDCFVLRPADLLDIGRLRERLGVSDRHLVRRRDVGDILFKG